MSVIKHFDIDYSHWLTDIKSRIRHSQIKAAVKVNAALLHLYWGLGQDIVLRQLESAWGSGFFERLSKDLKSEFPHLKGFSYSNLKYCKQFYLFYNQDNTIRQQVVGELEEHLIFKIPWGHHIQIFSKTKSVPQALFYVQKTIENGWSRAVLMHFLEAGLYEAQGKALNNFARLLPEPQSDLAAEIVKDPYNFDFITLTEPYRERELEDALTANITKFLVELGQGFAYVGRQVPVKIGETERYIDLLFYHLELRCYIVIELKATKFEAEYTGKLGLYVSAINHQRKKPSDNPTIGMIICKTKDDIEVEYSLESSSHPIGISEYQLSKLLPENYKSLLPSIEEIEEGLKG
jgi:predicted nuclease of restriction endonuclease-like (RecB) superfamily